jgi:hypothetical protein
MSKPAKARPRVSPKAIRGRALYPSSQAWGGGPAPTMAELAKRALDRVPLSDLSREDKVELYNRLVELLAAERPEGA